MSSIPCCNSNSYRSTSMSHNLPRTIYIDNRAIRCCPRKALIRPFCWLGYEWGCHSNDTLHSIAFLKIWNSLKIKRTNLFTLIFCCITKNTILTATNASSVDRFTVEVNGDNIESLWRISFLWPIPAAVTVSCIWCSCNRQNAILSRRLIYVVVSVKSASSLIPVSWNDNLCLPLIAVATLWKYSSFGW